ncbi:ribbon-helix-helix domain-containing protein [Rhizobium laguerreae]|uniref:ribbon-helix-helix domain-containing protein n=1 Tax=Rhizobium laguerreae TaxID=1076926 RepID=UPI001C928E1C|nr:ribbon-helix-helix domain-containing protein [Rhizobium laguerreae]MBY3137314.1 hypothetical protein [Rhizobium laguerreae]
MKLVAAHLKGEIIDAIDACIGRGMPGDPGHYASRSAFIRAAIAHLLDEQATPSVIRHCKSPLQPVATHADA